jgi:hypothetical protein
MKKLAVSLIALLMLSACSSEPTKTTQQEKPKPKEAELITGRSGFYKMFIQARGWKGDAQLYRLMSQPNGDSKGRDGKSAIWKAWFASPGSRASKAYVWSGTDSPDAPSRGVSFGAEDTYSPNNASTQVFDQAFLKIDTDQAFEVAQQHGGDKVLEKNPDLNIVYLVDWNRNENELVWHVYYGNNRDDAKLKIAVNASTGEFLRKEK